MEELQVDDRQVSLSQGTPSLGNMVRGRDASNRTNRNYLPGSLDELLSDLHMLDTSQQDMYE